MRKCAFTNNDLAAGQVYAKVVLKMKEWTVYILECKDGTLYTGITDNLERRLAMHRIGKGAKYTKGRGPFVLRYTENCEDKSHALRKEIAIKRMPRQEKLRLINK